MSVCVTILLVILCFIAIIVFIKLYSKLTAGWDRSPTCLVGKTAIVTGSNTGIGYYTARDFAKRGARVILACRDPHRAEQARAKITEDSGNQNIIVRILDLGSLSSVREFAKIINATEDRLDILVNNAGAGGFEHTSTTDGMSLSMQINHFGPFLLTILLLDLLKRSTPSRIVVVTSSLAHLAKLDLSDLNAPARGIFSNLRDYNNSKLLNILFANELARKLKGTGIDVNSLHPGAVQTDFFRHLPSTKKRVGNFFMKAFYKTTDEGAQTSIYVSVSKDISGISGEYFSDCKKGWMPKAGRDVERARQVWVKCEEFVKLTPEEKMLI